MQILKGLYGEAKVFTDNIEQTTSDQIVNLMNQPFVEGAKIRIMPDTHAGAGCVIGFTANLGDKVVPNLVGVDIGCGMLTVELGKQLSNSSVDLNKLDEVIHQYVPAGFNVHDEAVDKDFSIEGLKCLPFIKDGGKINRSIGTLGGGNHFIEIDEDEHGDKYLIIHSGSRNLGKQVAEYYQNMAIEFCKGLGDLHELELRIISNLKDSGESHLIAEKLKEFKKAYLEAQPTYPKELCYLIGKQREDYLGDMMLCQLYASTNRYTMANIILSNLFGMSTKDCGSFETVHNYIDNIDNVIRKGAVSAYKKERLIIPMNMRDGSIIAVGKGNEDWNNSAPHGAGRLMGRMEAKRKLSMTEFTDQMSGIYTTTANQSTLDEAPMAYKPMQEILDNIGDTVDVLKIIKPIYNFKSAE